MIAGHQPAPNDLPRLFAAAMDALGPFPPAPRLAAGVSGGADSLALALLADGWVRPRGGSLLALIVDHGLRPEAAGEASATVALLTTRCIAAQILRLDDLSPGPGLAARARAARFDALTSACAAAGITDLLLGHHAADQAETLLIRALSGSGATGMAGMAVLREVSAGRRLRPLLGIAPGALRNFLRMAGAAWVEDPSNANPTALRARLRALRGTRAGDDFATNALLTSARVAGLARAQAETEIAAWLAAHASLRPEGFAVLPRGPWPVDALASLIRAVSGADFSAPIASVTALAARPRAATLAGARLLPAGKFGPGWLLIREAAAMAPPIPARAGVVWDRRFRLLADLPDTTFGALGTDAACRRGALPAAILATLPALRHDGRVMGVPHLDRPTSIRPVAIRPTAPHPAAPPTFVGLALQG